MITDDQIASVLVHVKDLGPMVISGRIDTDTAVAILARHLDRLDIDISRDGILLMLRYWRKATFTTMGYTLHADDAPTQPTPVVPRRVQRPASRHALSSVVVRLLRESDPGAR